MSKLPVCILLASASWAIASCLMPSGAQAASRPASAPTIRSQPVVHSRAATTRDLAALKSALKLADDRNWIEARKSRARIRDRVARSVVSWRIARAKNSGTGFRELADLLSDLGHWPKMGPVRARAESLIGASSLSHKERIEWLETSGPVSGVGKVRLAESLRATGQKAKANRTMRALWRTDHLPYAEARRIMRSRRWPLTAKDHWIRADMLTWTNRRKQARLLMPRIGVADRRLIAARLALIERRSGVDWAVRSVPASRTRNPGLLYDRARWRRRKGRRQQAIPLLLSIRAQVAPESARPRIWRERSLAVRRLLTRTEYAAAYRLAADHGMERGVAFADAEWISGWLALRHLNDPLAAMKHFRTMREAVSTPISLARADYWLGRAMTDLDRLPEAYAAYGQAAAYAYTYYGQLAVEEAANLNGERGADMSFPAVESPSAAELFAFENKDLVRAATMLADLGRMRAFETFVFHIDDQLASAPEHGMLYDLAASYLRHRAALRSAKAGMGRGMIVARAAYPIPGLHAAAGEDGVIETALLLALSRQESEFDPKATSRAGAMGMMQLMPATARRTARNLGIRYRRNWLRDDPSYNLRLGRAHLIELLERFDGSYVMALAAYNAGSGRVEKWVRLYGDPRKPQTDAIDWVENIPFSETRNYVQRVLEAVQVYRHRLRKRPVPISLRHDLTRGRQSET